MVTIRRQQKEFERRVKVFKKGYAKGWYRGLAVGYIGTVIVTLIASALGL